jgi:hypothetical protein
MEEAMSNSPEDILSKELAKLTGLSSSVGSLLSGHTDGALGAGVTAALGTQFAERFLPTERYYEKFMMPMPPEKALKRGFSVLAKMGAMEGEEGAQAPYPFLKAVVRSGFMGMNPAVVFFEILDGDASSCEVTVTAAAKEGLIKQQTAQKAVQSVIGELKRLI